MTDRIEIRTTIRDGEVDVTVSGRYVPERCAHYDRDGWQSAEPEQIDDLEVFRTGTDCRIDCLSDDEYERIEAEMLDVWNEGMTAACHEAGEAKADRMREEMHDD